MKTKIKDFLTFIYMVVVLGTQTLLEGSWKVEESPKES
ncbi:hypothetical protein FB2170_06805 [Maribacter sp. HTCC2170]|nr:hypothetical protein FB2170_06805 [Maribacter sp. HTCC2170]